MSVIGNSISSASGKAEELFLFSSWYTDQSGTTFNTILNERMATGKLFKRILSYESNIIRVKKRCVIYITAAANGIAPSQWGGSYYNYNAPTVLINGRPLEGTVCSTNRGMLLDFGNVDLYKNDVIEVSLDTSSAMAGTCVSCYVSAYLISAL